MTTALEKQTDAPPALLAGYEEYLRSLPPADQTITDLRRRGHRSFAAQGLPSTRLEDWRFTNVAALDRTAFRRASRAAHGLGRAQLEPFLIPGCMELIFVNGHLDRELSRLDALPAGVFVGSLAEALAERPELVLPHLGAHADLEHPFVALNTAHLADGAFVLVPRGVVLERAIHALYLSIGEHGEATVSYPRSLFVAEENAQMTVVETFGGFGEDVYFTCPVTEIVGGAASVIDHYKLGEESLGAFHLAFQKVTLGRQASFFSHSINYGGGLVRNDIQAWLGAEGVDCTLNGLYLAAGKQQIDHYMRVDHAKPHCNSYELFKGILEGHSRATFNGRIHVHQDAQKTDAKQSSRNLILSADALVHSNPQLEIFADDVRCTHGSTTGHLDDEAVFYLRSRGIAEDAAKSLLTYAFAAEVLQEIRLAEVKKDLEEFLFTRLPKGDVVRQAY